MGNSLRVKYAAGVKLSLLFGLLLWLVMAVGAGCGSSQEGDFDAGLPRNPAAVAPSLAQLGAESLRAKKGQGKGQDKVTICHKGQTIQVAAPAVKAHLKHGDSLGACDEEPPSGIDLPVASTVVPFGKSIEFLFSGDDPFQTGLEPGTIDINRAAVIRGQVMTAGRVPVSGVTVSVLGYPEYGQTITREEAGANFDLVVNGGGALTLVFEKEGFLPAQRRVLVPWGDFVFAEDLIMVPVNPQATVVDLSSGEAQVARGNLVTDEDGARQSTVFFPPGVGAAMLFSDGTRRGLPEITLHITEYTVGDEGPAAMPADLPPTSAYTYCEEFTVEEARQAGAYRVEFTKPVVNYLENFLGFAAGDPVPVGVYNRLEGCWEPEPDGVVVRLLSIDNGQAILDVDGSGDPASQAELDELEITAEELATVASLYQPGETLWRVPLRHFSPCDLNYAIVFPNDAVFPHPGEVTCDEKDPCPPLESGSIIEITNQILRESVGVVGTPFTLNYASDRVPGRKGATTINVPLTGESIPASLQRVDMIVEVAGQQFVESFPPAPNLVHQVPWDGKDAYGRQLQGHQPVTVQIGFVYDGVYVRDLSRALTRTFGFPRATPAEVGTRRPVTRWRTRRSTARAGGWDARGLGMGGWSLSAHHVYDPAAQEIYFGDGSRQSGNSVGPSIKTVAGTGAYGLSGDGGPATEAGLAEPERIAIGPDGAVYISDTQNHCIRRIDAGGIITTVVGMGGSGFNGDGLLGTETLIDSPRGIAFGPEGRLYFADSGNGRVRRLGHDGRVTTVLVGEPYDDGGIIVTFSLQPTFSPEAAFSSSNWPWYVGEGSGQTPVQMVGLAVGPDCVLYVADPTHHTVWRMGPDGVVAPIAGTGAPGFSGDDGPSVEADLDSPEGVALTPEGSLLIADTGNHRVRRVGIDGVITTIAGNGDSELSGDGDLATQTAVSFPVDVSAGPGGDVFFVEQGTHRVRRVRPDGIMRTVTGTGQAGFLGDNGPAADGRLGEPSGVTAAPDGSLFIADTFNQRIRQVASPFGGAVGELLIPSADGIVVYRFDDDGRHLETIHSLTGGILCTFGYDSNGLLSEVTDGDGNVTTITRDSTGEALAISGPFGQQTLLAYDNDGYLAAIGNPAGETVRLTYADGLLASLIDPNGNSPHEYEYDALGRLVKDTDPAGGFKELARTELEHGVEVSVETAEGRVSLYRQEDLPTGEHRHTRIGTDGLQSVAVTTSGGTGTLTLKDGRQITATMEPDPRFGMQVPRIKSAYVTAAGLTSSTTWSRTATLSDPANPLSLTQLTTTATVNGRPYTLSFDATSRALTKRTPEGRQATKTLDSLGRTVRLQAPGLAPGQLSYDVLGRLAGTTVGNGADSRATSFSYDAQGRLETVTDPLGLSANFTYDLAGRPLSIALPGGRVVRVSYDANGNRTSVTPPDRPSHGFGYTEVDQTSLYTPPPASPGGSTLYTYNLDRQPLSAARPDGEVTNLSYDAAGRLESVVFERGSLDLGYGSNGNILSLTAPGDEAISFGYNQGLIASWTSSGTVDGSVGWVHDNDFQIRSRSVSGAGTLTLAYDDDGLLIKAGPWTLNRDPQNGLLTGTSLGQITDQVTRNQFAEVIAYEATAGGTSLYSQTLERDAIGRIQEHTESVLGVARTYIYSYDEANRLAQVREDGQVVGTYSYDANGNRISVTTADGTVLSTHDDQDRLLTQGNTTFTYSANGELESRTTGGETTSYDYDSLGNLMEVALPDGRQIQYRMDGYGRRLAKLVNGIVVRKWLYADGLLPLAELDASDNLISVFNGSFMVRDGETYRIITDHVGSPRLVVDTSTGEVAQQLTYDEWGNITEDTNPGFQPFGFAGGLYDPDTGLVRFGARDYDPLAGRWTAKDPIRFGGGTANLYAYANNNPVNYTDPEGLALESGWDAFNVGLGVTSFGANLYSGNLWGAAEDALGLTLDIGATAVPGVPGGAATFLQGKRAVKAADTILDAAVDLRKAKKSTGRTPRLDTDGAQDAVDNMENLDGFGDKLKKYKKDPAGELPFDRDAWLKDRRRTKQDMQKRFRDARGDAQEAIDDFSY